MLNNNDRSFGDWNNSSNDWYAALDSWLFKKQYSEYIIV
jgi:hypothetical protein